MSLSRLAEIREIDDLLGWSEDARSALLWAARLATEALQPDEYRERPVGECRENLAYFLGQMGIAELTGPFADACLASRDEVGASWLQLPIDLAERLGPLKTSVMLAAFCMVIAEENAPEGIATDYRRRIDAILDALRAPFCYSQAAEAYASLCSEISMSRLNGALRNADAVGEGLAAFIGGWNGIPFLGKFGREAGEFVQSAVAEVDEDVSALARLLVGADAAACVPGSTHIKHSLASYLRKLLKRATTEKTSATRDQNSSSANVRQEANRRLKKAEGRCRAIEWSQRYLDELEWL